MPRRAAPVLLLPVGGLEAAQEPREGHALLARICKALIWNKLGWRFIGVAADCPFDSIPPYNGPVWWFARTRRCLIRLQTNGPRSVESVKLRKTMDAQG